MLVHSVSTSLLRRKFAILLFSLPVFVGFAVPAFNMPYPPHALKYSDEYGYALYTRPLGILEIADSRTHIRMLFSTDPKTRKSSLLSEYWTFSLFDSCMIKEDKNSVRWITPGLSVKRFVPAGRPNTWIDHRELYEMQELGGPGNYNLKGRDGKWETELRYRKGRLNEIRIVESGKKALVYKLFYTKNECSMYDSSGQAVYSVARKKADEFDIRIGNTKITLFTSGIDLAKSRLEFPRKIALPEKEIDISLSEKNKIAQMKISDSGFDENISWDLDTGTIASDSSGKYRISRGKHNQWVDIEYLAKNPKRNARVKVDHDKVIYDHYYGAYHARRFLVVTNSPLRGAARKIEIKKNGEKLKTTRRFFLKDETITINESGNNAK